MSRQVDLGQIVPNIQVGTTTTGSPSSQASVINIGTDLNPILNFTIPQGKPGSIKFEIVQQLPTEDIEEDTIYLVPYAVVTVEELPSTGALHTIYIVSSTNKRYVYESSQWIEIASDNRYIEYIYVNGNWEELGGINVDIDLTDYYTKQEVNTELAKKQNTIDNDHKLPYTLISNTPDLTDYVKNTDYATDSVGGVIKSNYGNGFGVSNSGALFTHEKTYAQYTSGGNAMVIGKGTLENVITGKGLVSNTDYASANKGGVIKAGTYGLGINNSGIAFAQNISYTDYQNKDNIYFISKGTLENVLTAKIGDIQTLLDNLNTGNGV